MTKLLAICQNTFVQTVRQPVFTWMLLVALAVSALSVPLTTWAMSVDYHKTNQKMLEGLGLGTLLVCGLIVASFSASSVLSREIEDKTALTVISKPVSRPTFVAGKFIGVAGAVMLFFYLAGLIYLMTLRHGVVPAAFDKIDWPVIVLAGSALLLGLTVAATGNVLFNWTFTSAFVYSLTATMSVAMVLIAFIGKGWEFVSFGQGLRWQLFLALGLMAMVQLIFVAIAVTASTRFGQVATLLICLGVLAVGSEHTKLFDHYKSRLVLSYVAHWGLPNLGYFYAIDALTLDNEIPLSYAALAGAYCACYVVGVLAVGAAMFQRRSLEGSDSMTTIPGVVGFLAAFGQVMAVIAVVVGLEAVLAWMVGHWHSQFQPIVPPVTAPLIAAGAGMWVFWNFFARGSLWCYRILVALTVAASVSLVISLLGLWAQPARVAGAGLPVPFVLLAMLLLPRTRRHFRTATVEITQ